MSLLEYEKVEGFDRMQVRVRLRGARGMCMQVGRMGVRLKGETSEKVDYFKYHWAGGCERGVGRIMNEECEYEAWGVLKSVLSNRGLGLHAKKSQHERVIVGW